MVNNCSAVKPSDFKNKRASLEQKFDEKIAEYKREGMREVQISIFNTIRDFLNLVVIFDDENQMEFIRYDAAQRGAIFAFSIEALHDYARRADLDDATFNVIRLDRERMNNPDGENGIRLMERRMGHELEFEMRRR